VAAFQHAIKETRIASLIFFPAAIFDHVLAFTGARLAAPDSARLLRAFPTCPKLSFYPVNLGKFLSFRLIEVAQRRFKPSLANDLQVITDLRLPDAKLFANLPLRKTLKIEPCYISKPLLPLICVFCDWCGHNQLTWTINF